MEIEHENRSPLEKAQNRLEASLVLLENEFLELVEENNQLREEISELRAMLEVAGSGIDKLINQAEKMLEERP